jgi:hypothetical protein
VRCRQQRCTHTSPHMLLSCFAFKHSFRTIAEQLHAVLCIECHCLSCHTAFPGQCLLVAKRLTCRTTKLPKMSPSSSLRGSQLSLVSTLTANSPKIAPEAPKLTVTAPRTTAGCSSTAAAAAPAGNTHDIEIYLVELTTPGGLLCDCANNA